MLTARVLKNRSAAVLFLWISAGCFSIVHAQPGPQTLSGKLIQEGAPALARAARKQGSAIRGAILYPQKKLNCANCHAPAAKALGPNLTEIGKDVPDEHFVESILLPSKVIKKGYESVKVLTTDGQVLLGRIVTDDDGDDLALRDPTDTNKVTRIARDDIETVSPNDQSTMPQDLADQLKDRQQFLDLVRYLMEIAATSKPDDPDSAEIVSGQVDARIRGLALMDHFTCQSCHQGNSHAKFPNKGAPDLKDVGNRVDPQYIRRFIADPQHAQPGTSMPNVMHRLGDDAKSAAADKITHYLMSLGDRPPQQQPIDPEASARGKETYHAVGCVACHGPRDGSKLGDALSGRLRPLTNVHEKYNVPGLIAFLKDPHSVRPAGRMPNLALSHWEAIDIANFLLLDSNVATGAEEIQADKVAAGRLHFQQLGCAECHRVDNSTSQSNIKPLAGLNAERGCLSETSGDWPLYQLRPQQREDLRVAIEQYGNELSDAQQVTLSMETFRCYSCHQRDNLGGVMPELDTYCQTEDQNLGPQGRIPPTLTGVGAKLKPTWLREVLVSGRAIRPYMKTRMPQFGAQNIQHLVDLLPRVDQLPETSYAKLKDQKEAKKVGTDLVGRDGLNCIACHTYRLKRAETMSAVDLTDMAKRLQKPWFYHYMRAPQRLSPRTVMPSFWPGGTAIRKDILDGDMESQIEAIWIYLQEGRQARQPRGLIQPPMQLLAGKRAVILRRSYQGIGKRGIGVGYPGGVNLAFDAEQMRLAMIWKGPFADPGGVWRGQGSGTVRPLSREVLRFPNGPDLDDGQSPWVVDDGRPPSHQFKGYYLDQLDRPTFMYRFDGIEVEDYCIDVIADGSKSLLRTITLQTREPRNNVSFRVAAGETIEPQQRGLFLIGNKLRIKIQGENKGRITKSADGKDALFIPFDLPAGQSQITLSYRW